MAQENEHSESDVKIQFTTREGVYRQAATSDFFYPKRVPFVSPSSPSHTAVVKTSYVRVKQEEDDEQEEDCICFTVGKNLFYFTYSAFKQSKQFQFVDKRQYKGAAPSCHDVNQYTASPESVKVAVGFLAGQVQIIDVRKKESLQIMNEVVSRVINVPLQPAPKSTQCNVLPLPTCGNLVDSRSVDKSSVTCVKWYPNNDNLILASHICGFMYTYDITMPCSEVSPCYHAQPHKIEEGYSIFTVKTKSTSISPNSYNSSNSYSNPLYKWVMTTDGTAVCSFQFSPCNRFVAVVTQNGYLRVIDHQSFECYGCMKSYFGGLMTCSWSPDGRFIVTGGEDDLITVWSFCQQCVVARGSSHKSWVSDIAFDPYQCTIPSDSDMKTYYHLTSVNEFLASRKSPNFDRPSRDALPETTEMDEKKSPSLLRFKKIEDKSISRAMPQCNGDSKLSIPSNAMKRLRTYSNVSRISRISMGIDTPSLCYRFGSIGQDSQLCLWEIDENIIDFMHRRPSAFKIREQTPIEEHSNESPNPVGSTSDIHASSTSDYSSTGSNNYQYYSHNPGISNSVGDPPASALAAGSRSSSVPAAINTAISSKKEGKPSKSSNSNGFSMIRKFATIGTHDRSRKENKQHKRNLSLPHFGSKSSSQNGSSSKLGNHRSDRQSTQTLGTALCPCLEDTHMLDPLTCKKVSPSRLTSIAFKEDSILITCQEGYMQAWQRPNVADEELSTPSSPSTSNGQIHVNGTVV